MEGTERYQVNLAELSSNVDVQVHTHAMGDCGPEPGFSQCLSLTLSATDQGYVNIAGSPFLVQYRFENDVLFRRGFEF